MNDYSKHSLLQNGNICLTQEEGKCPLDKYTFSNVMILSVKLGVWETLLDKYIESLAPLTQVSKKYLRVKLVDFFESPLNSLTGFKIRKTNPIKQEKCTKKNWRIICIEALNQSIFRFTRCTRFLLGT